ncbi:hypothetical protein PLICRDRAFT_227065 [Plicaturopsis crispa FD-325 SS-3]|nr:hypothetical protein PLICRDRAFT_227065 [Plicaturopsis crispa FD-325 SS-3]
MHRCLETFDTIVLIFSDIARSKDPDAARTTLARLARTCRAFHEVALDLLWEEQTDILPLLRCMPPDLWEVEASHARSPKWMLRRPIRLTDWQRCRQLGERIKILRMRRIDYEMSPEVSLALSLSLPRDGLLPNLHTLQLPWTKKVLFFCRPGLQLRELCFGRSDWYDTPTTPAPSLLLSFPSIYPNVKKFTLSASFEGNTACVGMACAWPGLEALELGNNLDFDGLRTLSLRLPNLHELDITWEDNFFYLGPSLYPSPPHMLACSAKFPQLRKLTLSIVEIGTEETALTICDTLLHTMDIPKLETIHILLRNDLRTSREASRSLLAWLGSHPALRSVRLQVPEASWDDVADSRDLDNALCRDTIQPLLSCRQLERFYWDCADGFDLDDADVTTMATAWPSLRWLELSSPAGLPVSSRITLQGLSTLLQLCPALKGLCLVIDATHTDVLPVAAPLNSALEHIFLGNSPIADAEAVAAVLSRVLPHLSEVDTVWERFTLAEDFEDEELAEEYDARWREVKNLLRAAASSAVP